MKFTEPLSLDFIKSQPYLILDTKFFDETFKSNLLSEFDNLDENSDGLLINSENFQAIRLLENKYVNKIKTIYIDPPYNAKSSEILYKNTFKHSSWISFMDTRVASSIKFLDKENGILVVAIDENEQENLGKLLDLYFDDTYSKIVFH